MNRAIRPMSTRRLSKRASHSVSTGPPTTMAIAYAVMRWPACPSDTPSDSATWVRMPAMTNSAVPMANADRVRIQTWRGIFEEVDMGAPRSVHERAAIDVDHGTGDKGVVDREEVTLRQVLPAPVAARGQAGRRPFEHGLPICARHAALGLG